MFATPQEAEAAFYDAFQRADLAAMMAVWHDSELIECIHPRGARLRGLDAVQASWRDIFSGAARMRLEIHAQSYTQSATLAVHIVNEVVRVEVPKPTQAVVIASNVYQLTTAGWRMILHHASPASVPAAQSAPAAPGSTVLH